MRPGTIASYHTTEWCGGQVYVEDAFPKLLFAADGEVYDLGGLDTLVVGGAYSIDKYYRLAHGWAWWPDEQPSPAIKEKVERVLAARDWEIDVVLSHTTPLRYEPVECFLPAIDQSKVDKSTEEWLGTIEAKLKYQHWYCGHYHIEKDIDRLSILFESIREF
jgi:3-oxoacid CoA-transferase subunit A